MVRIDRLRIRLPAGYQHRAAGIARLLGESISGMQVHSSRNIDSLTIGPLHFPANTTDSEIAEGIKERLASFLRRGP